MLSLTPYKSNGGELDATFCAPGPYSGKPPFMLVALAACGGGSAPATGVPSLGCSVKTAEFDFSTVAKGTDKLFVPVDEVKKQFDAKTNFLLVDARPPTDFAAGHLPGAVNVPYFEVDKHLDKVPKDKWVVASCGCPHAEAEQAARALLAKGYTKVKVIDEGFFGWTARVGRLRRANHFLHEGTRRNTRQIRNPFS